jgi:hypothetical protein
LVRRDFVVWSIEALKSKKEKRKKKEKNIACRHGPWANCGRRFCSKEKEDASEMVSVRV